MIYQDVYGIAEAQNYFVSCLQNPPEEISFKSYRVKMRPQNQTLLQ